MIEILEAVKLQTERARPDAEIHLAETLGDALRAAEAAGRVDVVVLDLSMPGMNGLDGIRRVRTALPAARVVIMSGTANPDDVMAAIRAGANGFLPKTLASEVFVQALNVVLAGGTYLPADILAGVPPPPGAPAPASGVAGEPASGPLTPREFQVLQAIVNGKSNKEIGRDLGLQEVTVKLHARRLYHKLGARNRAEVTAIAIEKKIVQRDSG